MSETNRQWLLRSRPVGMVCLGDAGQTALPRLRELIRLSLR